MTKHEQYNVKFSRFFHSRLNQYMYEAIRIIYTRESFVIKEMLNTLHIIECRLLLDEINKALNGQPFEPEFDYGNRSFSDNDYIEIKNNGTIDIGTVIFPLADIKQLLEEWIAFAKD